MTTGADLKLNGQALFGRQRTILGSFMGNRAELVDALKFVAQQKLKAVIDSAFSLQEAALAHRKMESREFFGKILLRP
jgi:D-arabinose 1-dehydrogenase-like Zn-dependent alcohol dehydrogenase